MAKLAFINKHFEEQQYDLVLQKTTVGRGNHNTLVICDKSVSATHCEILVNGYEVIVRDLGSSNGTFVDGARLTNQAQMQARHGNIIRFGLVEARLELPPPDKDDEEEGNDAKITAVMDLRELQADHRREEKRRKLHPEVEGKVEPSAGVGRGDSSGQTVLVPRRSMQRPRPVADTVGETSVSNPSKALIALIVTVAVVALSILVWWMWLKQ